MVIDNRGVAGVAAAVKESYIWLSLRAPAKVPGFVWLAAGLL